MVFIELQLPEEADMSTFHASHNTSTTTSPVSTAPTFSSNQVRVFLTRGLVAIAWAVAFASVSGSLTTTVSVGAGILLVVYPLIDAVANLLDARNQHGSARRLLLANAMASTLVAVALAVAATASVTAVVAVFGIWAGVAGAAQLVVALRRHAAMGKQWPMRLAGGVSVIFGIAFILAAAGGQPMLNMVGVYAATGGVDFVIEAWLLARRRRQFAGSQVSVPSAH
jgi:uncharacterized membrane protein HdeD (DUF308 family)